MWKRSNPWFLHEAKQHALDILVLSCGVSGTGKTCTAFAGMMYYVIDHILEGHVYIHVKAVERCQSNAFDLLIKGEKSEQKLNPTSNGSKTLSCLHSEKASTKERAHEMMNRIRRNRETSKTKIKCYHNHYINTIFPCLVH